jgi:uncharacterized protein YjbI with pentapeptide repeats
MKIGVRNALKRQEAGEAGRRDPMAASARFRRLCWSGMTVSALFLSAFSGPATAANCGSTAAPGLDWSGCSKSSIMLQGSDLHGANLSEAHLDNTDLSGANLTAANLEKATLVRAWLKNVKAETANFKRIEAYRSSFSDILASGASFVSAELQRADFSNAQLTNADFSKAELGRANFDKAMLAGSKFSLANLSRANLATAVIDGPVDFKGAFMFLTRIEGLDLSMATGLEQPQLDLACGDQSTKLPAGVQTPGAWPCAPDQKD